MQTARGRSVHAWRVLQLHASHDAVSARVLSLLPQGKVLAMSLSDGVDGDTRAKSASVTWVPAGTDVATRRLHATSRLRTPTAITVTLRGAARAAAATVPVAAEAEAEVVIDAVDAATREVAVTAIAAEAVAATVAAATAGGRETAAATASVRRVAIVRVAIASAARVRLREARDREEVRKQHDVFG